MEMLLMPMVGTKTQSQTEVCATKVSLRPQRQRKVVPILEFARRHHRRGNPATELTEGWSAHVRLCRPNRWPALRRATPGNGIGLRKLHPAEWRGPVIRYSQTLWHDFEVRRVRW